MPHHPRDPEVIKRPAADPADGALRYTLTPCDLVNPETDLRTGLCVAPLQGERAHDFVRRGMDSDEGRRPGSPTVSARGDEPLRVRPCIWRRNRGPTLNLWVLAGLEDCVDVA